MIASLDGITVLVEVFWKSGVALGIALCINALLRKKSADVRRLILSATVVTLLLAAIALPALPHLTATTPAWFHTGSAATAVGEERLMQSVAPATAATVAHAVSHATQAKPVAHIHDLPAIPILWFAGTILLMVRFCVGLHGLRRLRKSSGEVSDSGLHGLTSGVALLQHDTVPAPATWGILRPVILVPAGFEKLPMECRNAVLCHELAHVRSRDFLFRCVADFARAVIWFQPLIWIARRQLRLEQELACDNLVLAAGGKPSAYAKLLLDWDVRPGIGSLATVGMAHRSSLKQRLHALLDQNVRRDRVSGMGILAAWLVALAVALPLAAVSVTAEAPSPPEVIHPASPLAALPPARELPVQPIRPHVSKRAEPATPVLLAQASSTPHAPQPSPAAPNVRVASSPLPQFRSSTTLVITDATVKDENGKAIEGLVAGDFAVTEDGKPQQIAICEFQKVDGSTQASSYYVLAYYTTNGKDDGAYRVIGISLKGNPAAKLDFRHGYYANQNINAFVVDGVTDMDSASTITLPALLSKVDPEYSEEARKAKYSGTVTLRVDVDASGHVANVAVVKSLGMSLDEKAVAAVTRWRFRPAMQNGTPVPVQVEVVSSFRLL